MMSDGEFDSNSENSNSAVNKNVKQIGKGNGRTSMERTELSNRYQKKSQLEHIMLRPDTYIGSIERVSQEMWVFEDAKMVNKSVTYTPGLYKIFDEILVNASDNKQRDKDMKYLKVTIDSETGEISVMNDGKGIPVEIHKDHSIYIPDLIFGHLMTGENFEDTDQRVVGGRNGYGAKLANIFSSSFEVETNDSKSGKRYKQIWTENMTVKHNPKITKASGKDFTTITFTPDYARFGMLDGIDADTVALLTKRVYDAAGTTDKSVKVYLNGSQVKVSNFEQYIDLYLTKDEVEMSDEGSDSEDRTKKKTKDSTMTKIYEKVNDRWEVCISSSPDAQMQQVSFVNGICTTKGGQHVNYVADQVASKLQEIVKKKHKGTDIKAHQIKAQLWVFVNCLIVNPSFDSQTKENLTTRHPKFGRKEFLPKISDKTLKQLEKTEIVSNILYWAKAKEMKELSRKTAGGKKNKVKGIDKLDDANNAGGKHSENCTLILTEGDSAKTLAISGLSVVGRDNYGVFPLRGKLLNVRDATHAQIMKNEEIQSITKILGLQAGKSYTSMKELRYGHLMIMTDQDHDGSHIKGLLMNFLHHFWPSLLKIPGFLRVFITPIVKATKKNGPSRPFYTLPEYESWSETVADKSKWTIKYYKGLGTSTAKEAKEYFADLKTHQIDMEWEGNSAGEAIDMAFSKKRVNDRKEWLSGFTKGTFMNFNVNSIKYKEFVNRELILFSIADTIRSIPNVMDGLKPSQRKVLFGCFKRNLKSDIKVAQLVGYISEHAAYHHGEVSLSNTVVGMAQTYTGSNNINMLFPSGQFGSRIMGGKDAASSRYIFTRLANTTRHLFHTQDDPILTYLNDDGQSIEPEYYVPVIPVLLVNGSSGIGTGWSTDIPCFNPRDIVQFIKRKLISCEPEYQLVPWYRGFTGTIEPEMHATKGFTGRYKVLGGFERDDDNESIIITELPVGTWTQSYKQVLSDEKLFPEGFIKDIRENHTDTKVLFTLMLSSEAYSSVKKDSDLIKKFKLETTIGVTNMHAFDADGKIHKYESAEEIVEDFFPLRLEMYVKRKAHIEGVLKMEWSKLDNKARFVQMVIDGSIKITKRKRKELLQELASKGFDQFQKKHKTEVDENDEILDDDLAKGYDYLLSMALWSLTAEKVEQLLSQRDGKRAELETLQGKRAEDLWEEDLDSFLVALDKQDAIDEEEEVLNEKQRHKGKGKLKFKPQPKKTAVAPIKRLPLPLKKTSQVPVVVPEDEEVEILSLSERLKSRMMVSPMAPASKRSKDVSPLVGISSKPQPKKHKAKDVVDFALDYDEAQLKEVAPKKAALKKTAPEKAAPKKTAPKKAAPKKVAAEPKNISVDLISDSEAFDFEIDNKGKSRLLKKKAVIDSSDEEEINVENTIASEKKPNRRARDPKTTVYVELSDADDVEEVVDSEFDSDAASSSEAEMDESEFSD